MRKTVIIIVSAIVTLLITQSCSVDQCGTNKDKFLSNYNKLMDTIEDSGYDKENRKWNDNDEKFQQYVKECYENFEDDMTNKETKEFWGRAMSYYFKKFGQNVDLEQKGAEIGKLLEENIGDVSKELGNALKNIDIDINIDEEKMEEIFEELGSDIEKLGKKWGKILEDVIEKEK